MTLVVDASVALKWILDEPDSAAAAAVLHQPMTAPDWWLMEAANGLGKAMRRKEISLRDARDGLAELAAVPIRTTPAVELLDDALSLSLQLNHPVHDCVYLALSILRDGRLVTADGEFVKVLLPYPDLGRRVVLLADFIP